MRPTNVLYIMSDEHDARMMGCSGHPVWGDIVQTPNLDRLAARGARFPAAYTPCPICVPARASWATIFMTCDFTRLRRVAIASTVFGSCS